MSRYRRVVWNEGMLLTPHHFQQSDNYHEDLLNSRIASLTPYEWGLLDLQINRDAIANGFVEVLSCSGVWPDGLSVSLPQLGPTPDARPVEDHFSASATSLDVYLAIPSKRVGAANFQANGGASSTTIRYLQDSGNVVDETSGENEQQLAYARGNFKILFADELREGYSAIKIAVLERTATGQLTFSDKYVPPALHVGASAWLGNLLRQLVELLIAKSRSLGDKVKQSNTGQASFTAHDTTVFWMLHTINSAIPTMTHLFRTRIVHPERLYREMVAIAGGLMTFAPDRHPKDIVKYDHLDLYGTFRQLEADIRDLLNLGVPERCVPIKLEKVRESLYVGRVNDDQLLKAAEFILGVGATTPEDRLISRVPIVFKIADGDGIDAVINNALMGVTLKHASPPPGPIPSRVGMHYFRLDRNAQDMALTRFWDRIIGLKTIAIYVPHGVPDEFPEAKLEMYAIKP
jgi:type VI secretion system protein ImpJ